jgi:hypothetical protein
MTPSGLREKIIVERTAWIREMIEGFKHYRLIPSRFFCPIREMQLLQNLILTVAQRPPN